jgi:hypothetical protein
LFFEATKRQILFVGFKIKKKKVPLTHFVSSSIGVKFGKIAKVERKKKSRSFMFTSDIILNTYFLTPFEPSKRVESKEKK